MKDDNWQAVLRDPTLIKAEVKEHLTAENAYREAMMASTLPLQQAMFAEMRGRIKEDDSSVPAPDGDWNYYVEYRTGDQHPRYMRVERQGARHRDDPRIKEVPTLLELIGEDAREMITGISSVFAFERPIAAPPGVPAARLRVLRETLWTSLHDPGMVEWSKKVRPILPLSGGETEKLLQQALAAGGKLKPLLQESLK